MPDQNQSSPETRETRTGKDPNFNWRGLVMLAIAMLLIAGAFVVTGGKGRFEEITYPQFLEYLNGNQVYPTKPTVDEAPPSNTGAVAQFTAPVDEKKRLRVVRDLATGQVFLEGYHFGKRDPLNSQMEIRFKCVINLAYFPVMGTDSLDGRLAKAGIQPIFEDRTSIWHSPLMSLFMPVLLLVLLLYVFYRHQLRSAGRGAMSFGKSRAKMMSAEKNKVTFKDVAGVDEAKEEVWELVEFLKDPKKFQRLGGKIPKGILMVGSPGTGKTLLARAIAGEADVPFFSISGSDFVEMFVGVGASRVRDMFEQGKKNAPCLIFIDEIDAVGRHRGHGLGGGHDEREQTLNALLVEMDGFDTQEGVIIIAATNRPDVLDPALLRPGRFDRQVTVPLPDVKGREQILRVHAKRVKMSESVDLSVIARGTPGYSGAELANVLNEAALHAARKGLKAIGMEELEEARDKVRWGKERRSMAIGEKEKENTAYHEAGHAILLEVLEHTEPLHKVTIIPRGPSLGSTMWLPEEDKYNHRKNELLDQLVVTMGGRVAEELVFGDVTNGAMGDIRQATHTARKMVCEWGMSENLGMVEYGEGQEHIFLAREVSRGRDYSEDTAEKIDKEIKSMIDRAYARAKELLLKYRTALDAVAKALLEFETLDGKHIREIVREGRMTNPPNSPKPPDLPKSEVQEPAREPSIPDLPPGLTSAPAGA